MTLQLQEHVHHHAIAELTISVYLDLEGDRQLSSQASVHLGAARIRGSRLWGLCDTAVRRPN